MFNKISPIHCILQIILQMKFGGKKFVKHK